MKNHFDIFISATSHKNHQTLKFDFSDLAQTIQGTDNTSHHEVANSILIKHLKEITVAPKLNTANQFDIETAKKQAYTQGYEQGCLVTKEELKPQLEEKAREFNFATALHDTLTNLSTSSRNIEDQTETLNVIFETICEKFFIKLPTDFTMLLRTMMSHIASNGYSKGEIAIHVHPTKVDFCQKLINQGFDFGIPDAIKIIAENNLAENDCMAKYMTSTLIFKREELEKLILDTFTSKL